MAQNFNVKDEEDVKTVIDGMNSIGAKLPAYFFIFFGIIAFAVAYVISIFGDLPYFSLAFGFGFIWVGIWQLRTFKVMIPKVAQVYVKEELS